MASGQADAGDGHKRAQVWVEIFAAVLLASATLASAWSAYQATRWSGVQAMSLSEATAKRSESLRASNLATQQAQVDVTSFVAWVLSQAQRDPGAATFLEERFRKEFRPAFHRWRGSAGSSGPGGRIVPAGTPFERPEYQLAARERAEDLSAQAEAAMAEARAANQNGDNYIFAIVLFTSSVFFAGIQTKIETMRVRWALLGIASVLLLGAVGFMLRLPANIGF